MVAGQVRHGECLVISSGTYPESFVFGVGSYEQRVDGSELRACWRVLWAVMCVAVAKGGCYAWGKASRVACELRRRGGFGRFLFGTGEGQISAPASGLVPSGRQLKFGKHQVQPSVRLLVYY